MKYYPLFKVHVDVPAALKKVEEVLRSGFINEGKQVTELTEAMQHELKAKNLLLTNSCTSSLTLALHLCDSLKSGEVITTPMTCVATNTPIMTSGYDIVWADIDPKSGLIDPDDVVRKINRHTKAVMAVAWAGTPPDLERLSSICCAENVPLILDAAHAFGAEYKGSPIHEWADYTCYSFQAIKHITTGDGGALVCGRARQFDRAKALKWFGLDRDKAKDTHGNWKGQQWDVDIVEAGYKFNMNNLSAAIGLSQLPHIDRIIRVHQRNAIVYDAELCGVNGVVPASRPSGARSSHWVYTVILDERYDRDYVLKKLNDEGIAAGLVHVPNDDYTAFSNFKIDLPGVRAFSTRQFSLPCGWWMTADDVRHVVARLKNIIGE